MQVTYDRRDKNWTLSVTAWRQRFRRLQHGTTWTFFLGGMFGVAAMVAVFSASGTVKADFCIGFVAAIKVAAVLSLLGALTGLALPARHRIAAAPTPRKA